MYIYGGPISMSLKTKYEKKMVRLDAPGQSIIIFSTFSLEIFTTPKLDLSFTGIEIVIVY